MWAGVDVGGRRKGFHAAVIDAERLRAGPARLKTPGAAADWLLGHAPKLVAVDAPREPAPAGLRSRPAERLLAREVCGLRYTPERQLLEGNPYYEWIREGLELYAALERAGLDAVECYPTASWTRWSGPRGAKTRAAWSRDALAGMGLQDLPLRLGQDGRDAIGAALTARSHHAGWTQLFGAIVVPR